MQLIYSLLLAEKVVMTHSSSDAYFSLPYSIILVGLINMILPSSNPPVINPS